MVGRVRPSTPPRAVVGGWVSVTQVSSQGLLVRRCLTGWLMRMRRPGCSIVTVWFMPGCSQGRGSRAGSVRS